MMHRHLAAALALPLVLAAPLASAGGLAEPVVEQAPAPIPVAAPVAVGSDWTGFYAGGQLGYGNVSTPAFGADADGLLYGVHFGYQHGIGRFVLGGEIDYDRTDISDPTSGIALDSVTRLKLRAGYDAGAFLPYVVLGGARAETSGGLAATDDGQFAGLGVDYRLTDTVRVGGEVLQHQFNDFAGSGADIDATTLAARVSFQF